MSAIKDYFAKAQFAEAAYADFSNPDQRGQSHLTF